MKEQKKIHSVIENLIKALQHRLNGVREKRKNEGISRCDFSLPLDTKRLEVHQLFSEDFYVRFSKRIIRRTGEEAGEQKYVEEWIPGEGFRIFPKTGVVLHEKEAGEEMEKYSPERSIKDTDFLHKLLVLASTLDNARLKEAY